MPKHFAHDLRMHSLKEHERCSRMSEIMEADCRQPCLLQEWTQPTVQHLTSIKRIANCVTEDEVPV